MCVSHSGTSLEREKKPCHFYVECIHTQTYTYTKLVLIEYIDMKICYKYIVFLLHSY